MKKVLIASFDMEVGGVERSLISMLENFDYQKYDVDLMLYRHQGDFMNLLPENINLLKEIPQYATFRKSIGEILRENQYIIGISRLLSRFKAGLSNKFQGNAESGYYQMQLMWKYALPFLPKLENQYEVAISYLWPHYFVAEKVSAQKKIAWIHTDYSAINTDISMDLKMWREFDYIVAVSEACKRSFLRKYSVLKNKVFVIENLTSPDFIKMMANEKIDNQLAEDKQFKIVTVARLSHAKGIDNAVSALKILKDKGYKDIVWYVVGYGGEETNLKELIKTNNLENNFILLGKKMNPYPFINACNLYVQPSRYEGKAVTVTEAKILGKPILINNYSTSHSQINDGIDGIICKNSSVESLVEGIENLYNNKDLRNNLISNVKNKDFSNSIELQKLYKLIG